MQVSEYAVPGCPVTIALVTDLHQRPYGAVLASLRAKKPEIICIAGDFLFGRLPRSGPAVREAGLLPFFTACAALAPCFVSLGNHEWLITDEDMDLIRGTGAHVLDNSHTIHAHKKTRLVIGGLTSSCLDECRRMMAAGYERLEAHMLTRDCTKTPPQLGWLEEYCREPGYHILLCHHPEYYPRYLKKRDIQLILSGHAHGGQIRIFGQGLFAPGQGVFPRLTGGVKDGRLVISRGLANCQPVPRINNPPELVYIH